MFYLTKQGEHETPYVASYVADSEEDLELINTSAIAPGSTCIIIADTSVYMLDTTHTWRKL